eukprot:COSAG05_NODE_12912_length_449_cov_1.031429_1_plen_74_part_10
MKAVEGEPRSFELPAWDRHYTHARARTHTHAHSVHSGHVHVCRTTVVGVLLVINSGLGRARARNPVVNTSAENP